MAANWPPWWNAAWDVWWRANRRWVIPHEPPPPPVVAPPAPPPVVADDMHRITYAAPIPPSAEPMYTGAPGQTLLMQGDDSLSNYSSATNDGAISATLRLCPSPSPEVDGGAVNTTWCIIQATGGKTGGKSAQLVYPTGGGQIGGEWVVVRQASAPASAARYAQRYFKLSGTAIGTNIFAIKWAQFSLFNVPGGSRPQYSTHNTDPSAAIGGIGTVWQYYENGYTDGTAPTGNQGTQPVAPYFQNLFDSPWHRETIVYKPHTSSSVKDGFAQVWIDGTLIVNVQQSAVGVTPAGGTKVWCTQNQVDNMHTVADIGTAGGSVLYGNVRTDDPGTTVTIDMDIPSFVFWYQ